MLLTGIFDHLPVFYMCKSVQYKSRTSLINALRSTFLATDWQIIQTKDDAQEAYSEFNRLLVDAINLNMPITYIKSQSMGNCCYIDFY